jgi:iron(III) transport system permease protein
VLALFMARTAFPTWREQLLVLAHGSAVGVGLSFLDDLLGIAGLYYLLGGILVGTGVLIWFGQKSARLGKALAGLGIYLLMYDLIEFVAAPIQALSRAVPRGFWSNSLFQFSDYLKVIFQITPSLLAIFLVFAMALLVGQARGRARLALGVIGLALPTALMFTGLPLATVGTPFIILAAFTVRSLPASVRAGVAALQQIDPSLEEASAILGGDAQYTFRKVTLPLILPALLAGLIFSFTRHMTSLSAIIFLVSARWRIVTASILSEWEQGGVSIAAAYSTVIIIFVLVAIALLYFITNKLLRGRGDVDLSIGA